MDLSPLAHGVRSSCIFFCARRTPAGADTSGSGVCERNLASSHVQLDGESQMTGLHIQTPQQAHSAQGSSIAPPPTGSTAGALTADRSRGSRGAASGHLKTLDSSSRHRGSHQSLPPGCGIHRRRRRLSSPPQGTCEGSGVKERGHADGGARVACKGSARTQVCARSLPAIALVRSCARSAAASMGGGGGRGRRLARCRPRVCVPLQRPYAKRATA